MYLRQMAIKTPPGLRRRLLLWLYFRYTFGVLHLTYLWLCIKLAYLNAKKRIRTEKWKLTARRWYYYGMVFGGIATEQALIKAGARLVSQDRHQSVYRLDISPYYIATYHIRWR